jgi:threonine/homoserine/homoserine lactone efflux protein
MQVHLIDAVVKGLLLGLFMAISVGPTLFAVIKYSLNLSYKAGLAFVLGVSFSDIMYVIIANLAASWLEYLEGYERQIAYGGAIMLMGIGLFGLLKKEKPQKPSSAPVVITGGHYFKIWTSGFLVNTLNPGAFITWLGAVTLTANTSTLYRIVLFGICLIIILSVDFSKVFLADRIKRALTLKRIMYLHRASAACIFLIGAILFTTTAFRIQFKKHNGKSKIDNILTQSMAGRCGRNA